jgi:hypothetical protein
MNVSGARETIFKDRVWLALVFGPLVWMALLLSIMGRPLDVVSIGAFYSVGMCLSIGLISVFLPLMRGSGER